MSMNALQDLGERLWDIIDGINNIPSLRDAATFEEFMEIEIPALLTQ